MSTFSGLGVAAFFLFASAAYSQSTSPTVTRDTQAIAVLTQSVNAAGGMSAIAGVQDYTATGSVTYYWAGEEVPGTVAVKSRGATQFRVDATMTAGVRSWAVSNGAGFLVNTDGTNSSIPATNTLNLGNMTLPVVYLAASLQDANIGIAYVGLETKNGNTVHHIQLQKVFAPTVDPLGNLSRLTRRDVFIDSTSLQVLSTLDMFHPENQSAIDYPHEVQFSDFRLVNGILAPFSIVEFSSRQCTFVIQLSQINFNTGLQDLDFQQN
jgi:hypothetical protein